MAKTGVLITWREAFGAEPTMDMLRESLAPYSVAAVLLGISRLAARLGTWQNRVDLSLDRAIVREFLPSSYPKIQALYDSPAHRIVFSRITLLFVAKQALLSCQENGRDATTANDVEQILSCCLMANDLLLGRRPMGDDTTIDKVASLLPFSDYVSQDTYPIDISRSLHLIEKVAPQLAGRRDFIDIAQTFERHLGLTARQFCELAFCAGSKFITNLDIQLAGTGALILTIPFFEHTSLPVAQVRSFLRSQSTSLTALRNAVIQAATLNNDFTLFQRHPLIEFENDAFLCIDPGFLLDKGGRSLFWVLLARTPAHEQEDLLRYWGHVVEAYVGALFARTYQGHGQFIRDPRFDDGSQAGDVCLLEGSHLMIMEVKAITFTARAKYGFDPEFLGDELRRKVINGEDGKRKGIAQLQNVVGRILAGESISGLRATPITKIFPVLVFLDSSFVAPGLSRYYKENSNLRTLPRKKSCTVTPIFAITIIDLEEILPHTNRHPLSAIFEDYWSHNPEMAGGLSRGVVPLLQKEQPGANPIREEFEAFGKGLERHFLKPSNRVPGD